ENARVLGFEVELGERTPRVDGIAHAEDAPGAATDPGIAVVVFAALKERDALARRDSAPKGVLKIEAEPLLFADRIAALPIFFVVVHPEPTAARQSEGGEETEGSA